jgi:predicted nucleotidyltransferase
VVRFAMDRVRLAAFCRKHRIRELSFFGSVLRDDFGPESDVDVLVEFEPGARVTLFRLSAMEDELAGVLGRKVDLVLKDGLRGRFREHVLANREVLYVVPE